MPVLYIVTTEEQDQRAKRLVNHIARCSRETRDQVRCRWCGWLMWCPCFETPRPTSTKICDHCERETICQ